MIRTVMKLGLLMLSYFGYWEFFRSRCKINVYFAPLFTIACQFTVFFAAGILNYLKDAAVLIWLGGLVLLAVSLRKEKWKIIKPYLSGGYLFLVVFFAAAALYMYGQKFAQIDNFTHWATVVKNMLSTDRFPGFLDSAVEFTSYPLGSSAMIYYFCVMTGSSEHMLMLAQVFLMLCAVLPVFAFVQKRSLVSTVLIAMMTGFLFQYNIPITELLVDTLLPLAGMAAIAFVYHQCVMEQDAERLSAWYALPVMLWTMNIKHAALLYVVAAFAVLWFGLGRNRQDRRKLICSGLVLLAARSLWNRHCSYIDPEVGTSQHAVSVSWFSRIIGEKTKEDILRISTEFLEYMTTRREVLWFLAWILLLCLLTLTLTGQQKKRSLYFGLCVVSWYVIYGLGVLGMYIFSMPAADGLMAADRYMKSGDVAIYYMILVFAVSLLETTEKRGFAAASAVLLAFTAAGWRFQSGEYSNVSMITCTAEERARWEAPIDAYGIEKRHSYLLCISPEDDPGLNRVPKFVWQYNMESSSVDQIVVTDEAQLEKEKKYDYVIILDQENPVIHKWLAEHYPDKTGSQVIQHFV